VATFGGLFFLTKRTLLRVDQCVEPLAAVAAAAAAAASASFGSFVVSGWASFQCWNARISGEDSLNIDRV